MQSQNNYMTKFQKWILGFIQIAQGLAIVLTLTDVSPNWVIQYSSLFLKANAEEQQKRLKDEGD